MDWGDDDWLARSRKVMVASMASVASSKTGSTVEPSPKSAVHFPFAQNLIE